ncbi:hypothetical protein GCM10022419_079390 [Nonomuraea rosea]|uniref:Uncharacterized protein n=1 Tax=Nonomuraea rosea TaxID=638574 RepID=A0ABP6YMN9_9ACTN
MSLGKSKSKRHSTTSATTSQAPDDQSAEDAELSAAIAASLADPNARATKEVPLTLQNPLPEKGFGGTEESLNKRALLERHKTETPPEPKKPKVALTYATAVRRNPDNIKLYKVENDGVVGAEQGTVDWNSYYSWAFDDTKWINDANGRPMVLGRNDIANRQAYAARTDFVAGAYDDTVKAIDGLARQHDRELAATFWARKRRELEEMKTLTVGTDSLGVLKLAVDLNLVASEYHFKVAAGEYPIIGVITGKTWTDQGAPFSAVIDVGGAVVLVSPDEAWGIEESHVEEAKERKLDQRVKAEQISAVFTASPQFTPYVPTTPWITDDQIHYVTGDQMGAAGVLKRAPAGQADIDIAKEEDPVLFADQAGNPGLRLGNDIFIRDDQLGIGVEYHESVHKLSHPAMRNILGFWFNEGTTEYFTHVLLDQLVESKQIVRDDIHYETQHEGIQALIDNAGITWHELAEAYFNGNVPPLYDKVAAAAVHGGFSPDDPLSLDGYASRLDPAHAVAAIGVLKDACTDPGKVTTTTTTVTPEENI